MLFRSRERRLSACHRRAGDPRSGSRSRCFVPARRLPGGGEAAGRRPCTRRTVGNVTITPRTLHAASFIVLSRRCFCRRDRVDRPSSGRRGRASETAAMNALTEERSSPSNATSEGSFAESLIRRNAPFVFVIPCADGHDVAVRSRSPAGTRGAVASSRIRPRSVELAAAQASTSSAP